MQDKYTDCGDRMTAGLSPEDTHASVCPSPRSAGEELQTMEI
ncbi:hypothetical protein [Scytonema sp. PCC 10023]